jgi:hypothetical protein
MACTNPSSRPQRPTHLVGHGLDLRLVVRVHLQDVGGAGKALGRLLGQAHRPPERREDDLGTLLLDGLGDGERDRLARKYTRDEQLLPLEQHRPPSPRTGTVPRAWYP